MSKFYMNKIIIAGSAHNVKVIETKSGKAMVNFNLRHWIRVGDKDVVTFFSCNAYSGIAENITKNLKDGENVWVEGYIQTHRDKDDIERFSVAITEFKFVGDNRNIA